jgi:hypothetical protein
MKGNGYEDDILEGPPPHPPSKRAKSSGSAAIPKGSDRSSTSANAAVAVLGAQPTRVVIEGMANIENEIKRISRFVPGLADAAAPFIAQLRDMGAGALANLAQGGIGAAESGAGAPPPVPGGAPEPAGPGGGGAGMPMMPPPPM